MWSRARDLRRRRSAPPCARARGRSSNRRSSRAPGCTRVRATTGRARDVRRRSRAPRRTRPTVRPTRSSSVSIARLRNFSGIRADHTPGSRLAVRAPMSAPCHSRAASRSDCAGSRAAAVSSRTRSTGAATRRPSALATSAVCVSGGRWSKPFISSTGQVFRDVQPLDDREQALRGGLGIVVGVEPGGAEVALAEMPRAYASCRPARATRYSGPSASSSAPLPRQ